MRTQTTKLYNWALLKAESKRSPIWLSTLFFLEITLFLPLDALLMFFCLQNRKKITLYILLASIASTVSGLIGYLVGHFLWDLLSSYIVPHLISASAFSKISLQFQNYEALVVFFGALLPFPIKILTLSAGAFHLGIIPFITYFVIARLIRFTFIGVSMIIWGDQVKAFLDRHFHRILMILGAKIASAFAFLWFLAK